MNCVASASSWYKSTRVYGVQIKLLGAVISHLQDTDRSIIYPVSIVSVSVPSLSSGRQIAGMSPTQNLNASRKDTVQLGPHGWSGQDGPDKIIVTLRDGYDAGIKRD